MKKKLQLAIISIVFIVMTIFAVLTFNGLGNKMNVYASNEAIVNLKQTKANTAEDITMYENEVDTAYGNPSKDKVKELGNGSPLVDLKWIQNYIDNAANAVHDSNIQHYYLYLRCYVSIANVEGLQKVTIGDRKVLHILINGFSISGFFKVDVNGLHAGLRIYDYIPKAWNDLNTWGKDIYSYNNTSIKKYYKYENNTGGYTTFIGHNRHDLLGVDVTNDPNQRPNLGDKRWIEMQGSALGPNYIRNGPYNEEEREGYTELSANRKNYTSIQMYGINIVGNQTKDNPVLDVSGSEQSHAVLSFCNIIGNGVSNTTALRLNKNLSGLFSNIEIKWTTVYGNGIPKNISNPYAVEQHSDMVSMGDLISGKLYKNTFGYVAEKNENTWGKLNLAQTKIGNIQYQGKNFLEALNNINLSGIFEIVQNISFTYTQYNHNLSIVVYDEYNGYGGGNIFTLGNNSAIKTIDSKFANNNTSCPNQFIFVGHVTFGENSNNTLFTFGNVQLQQGAEITLSRNSIVRNLSGQGKVTIQDGAKASVLQNCSLNEVEVQYGGICTVEGAVNTVLANKGSVIINGGYVERANNYDNGQIYINDAAIIKQVNNGIEDSEGTVVINGGRVESITGVGSVQIINGSATITDGNTKSLYGSGGTVTIQRGTATITNIVRQAMLSAAVYIQQDGKLIVNGTVDGEITNNGTLNIAGAAHKIKGNGVVTIQSQGKATIPEQQLLDGKIQNSGTLNLAGKMLSHLENNGIFNILQEAIYTVPTGTTLFGTINNYGMLTIANSAKVEKILSFGKLTVENGGSITNLQSQGETWIKNRANLLKLVVVDGHTYIKDNATVEYVQLKAGTLEIDAGAKVITLEYYQNQGTLIDNRIPFVTQPEIQKKSLLWLWIIIGIILSGLLIVGIIFFIKKRKNRTL